MSFPKLLDLFPVLSDLLFVCSCIDTDGPAPLLFYHREKGSIGEPVTDTDKITAGYIPEVILHPVIHVPCIPFIHLVDDPSLYRIEHRTDMPTDFAMEGVIAFLGQNLISVDAIEKMDMLSQASDDQVKERGRDDVKFELKAMPLPLLITLDMIFQFA